MSRGRTDQQLARVGLITLVMAVVLMAAALNLQKFPGMRGTGYQAELTDGSGLRKGNMVQVAGVNVGRVAELELAGDHVVVHFTVDGGMELGDETEATVEVLNLLGEKFLNLRPRGEGQLEAGDTIPRERTSASYDIVRVFGELADTTERIDIPQLQQALTTVADTMDRSSDEAAATFTGLSRLATAIAERDQEIQSLLTRAESVSRLLAERRGDIVSLVKDGDLILTELRNRRTAIHTLLVTTRQLSVQLGGLVDDNQAQLAPMLKDLQKVTGLLVERDTQLRDSIAKLAPYASILSNIIGTGPWFDAYAVNLLALPSGEFVPEVD